MTRKQQIKVIVRKIQKLSTYFDEIDQELLSDIVEATLKVLDEQPNYYFGS